MRAAVYRRFGPPEVLALEQVPDPVAGPKDVLVAVRATTVTSAEAAMRRGEPIWGRVILGFVRPRQRMRTLGIEFAGVVTHVGEAVREFAVGDEVFGFTGFAIGANAEILRMPAQGSIARKPVSVSFAEAAAVVDGASTALYFLRDKARLHAGQKVLVIGASGSIGTYAIQLARHFGAEVTGVCSTSNVELVLSLGAHEVIDYTRGEIGERQFDLIIDNIGNHSLAQRRKMMAPTGKCVVIGAPKKGKLLGPITAMVRAVIGSKFRKQKFVPFMAATNAADLEVLAGFLADGRVVPVVTQAYSLADAPDAFRRIEDGHTRGKLVLAIG